MVAPQRARDPAVDIKCTVHFLATVPGAGAQPTRARGGALVRVLDGRHSAPGGHRQFDDSSALLGVVAAVMSHGALCHVHTANVGSLMDVGPAASSTAMNPAQQTLWGVLRAAAQESTRALVLAGVCVNPQRRAVDTPNPPTADAFGCALHGGFWHTPRLVQYDPTAEGGFQTLLDSAAASEQVVTGSSGALAKLFACWTSRRGGMQLHLLSRTGAASTETLRRLQRGEMLPAVRVTACDMTRRSDSTDALRGHSRYIGSVMHTAGVLADALLSHQTRASMLAVASPKVDATRMLLDAVAHHPVGAVTLFSSVFRCWARPGSATTPLPTLPWRASVGRPSRRER
jgi:hypothetical protein